MSTIPVMAVYGTRPEAIKMAPIVRELRESPLFACEVVVTGQHREMLDQINRGFGIEPDRDLAVFEHAQGPGLVAARTLERLTPVLREARPEAVLVQGDTASAFAAGLAAFYERVPVVHVEAGLRTDSLAAPFPEEGNRRLLTRISALHLAPTRANKANLVAEGVEPGTVAVTGNPVIDALLAASQATAPVGRPEVASALASGQRLALVTSHRRESWGEPMRRVAGAIAELAAGAPDVRWIFPLHANPLVRDIFVPALEDLPNVTLTEPLDYLDLARVVAAATLVVTDSGGIQEEAPSLGVPVLVLRDTTERMEGVAAGTARLVGTDPDAIVAGARRLLEDPAEHRKMAQAVNPYGDGKAAARTVAALAEFFGVGYRLPDFGAAP
ncbi:MAG: UDP-N-acetylglucosamine 2-epimerase (non-hydrolyzing) [Bifidobacteriaceae bacterium]|nr:UDP-N-acetylglucosamine 2-epimerase (non-hydrolyzing) [Bifidobacteriaceae bacterium]